MGEGERGSKRGQAGVSEGVFGDAEGRGVWGRALLGGGTSDNKRGGEDESGRFGRRDDGENGPDMNVVTVGKTGGRRGGNLQSWVECVLRKCGKSATATH